MGAPNLTDKFWIYGGDPQTIYETVWGGRQGHMPTWEARLSDVDRKILALYLVSLRTGGNE
jgi:cytochrome c oxidase cbb3-type subunit 3